MIGSRIAQYEVLAKIGEGGMGQVYRARDTRLDRDVALKVLPDAFAQDPERLARFRREAKLLASLHHTHIAALHGLEEVDGRVFLVMELVEGEDLSVRLARGPLDQEDALELARQFAEGLEAAHEQNIVHRDLKPANLKLTPDGRLKILDFGLARAYLGDGGGDEDLEQSPTITAALTAQGVILGTAAYMSPEQARGRRVDQRTDIWAFGAILFEMLTGQRVFTGETISDTMAAVLRADPPWDILPKGTPAGLRRLLERCLERDARRRLRDIGEARVRLERWREDPSTIDETILGLPSGEVARAAGGDARRVWLPWALLVVAVVALGVQLFRQTTQSNLDPRYTNFRIRMESEELQRFLLDDGNLVAISPDGNWLAWVGSDGLRLRNVARDQSTVVQPLDATAMSMDFSPDSQWLAFGQGSRLRRVSVSGGTPIDVVDAQTLRGVAWVDENTLVYPGSISMGLSSIDLRTGEVTQLTELDTANGERSHRWPTRIPGRRAVVYECQFVDQDYEQSDVRWVDLDSGEGGTLLRGGAAPRLLGDGVLLFARSRALFAAKVSFETGVTSLPISVVDNLVTAVGNQEDDDGSAQYSVDDLGTLVYRDAGAAESRQRELTWIDLATGETKRVGGLGAYTDVRVSPDGLQAVVSRERNREIDLFVLNLETGAESQLTSRRSVEYLGCWSPDSKTFYWSQGADSGSRYEIWRRAVNGTTPAEFVALAPNEAGMWPTGVSPDGRYLAFSAWMGPAYRDLWTLDLQSDGAEPKSFVNGPRSEDTMTWLGESYVVYLEGSPQGRVVIRHFPDDGATWTLPEVEGGYFGVSASTDGRSVYGFGPSGNYRFDVQATGNGLEIGTAQPLSPAFVELMPRIAGGSMDCDRNRGLLLLRPESADVGSPPSVRMITGWAQSISKMVN